MNVLFEKEYDLVQIDEMIAEVWPLISENKIVALKGEMGAGKTTFVSHLAKFVGITDEVSSPTFSIINEYIATQSHAKIYHLDLYRIEEEAELLDIGFEELLESNFEAMFIEWPQIAQPFLPAKILLIHIDKMGETSRKITIMKDTLTAIL